MDRFEIVDCRANGEAVFWEYRPKWLLYSKTAKMAKSRTKQAGSECTLSKPLSCPNNGETLKETAYDVFSSDGVFLFTIKVPGHIYPQLAFKNGHIYALKKDEAGYSRAIRFKVN
jgi:hypothetical protein